MTPDYLTTAEVASTCRVTEATVTAWVREGKLQAYRPRGGRNYLFRPGDVAAFLVPAEHVAEPTPEAAS